VTAPVSRRPLWTVVGLLAAAAVALWVGALRGGGAAQSALAVLALAMVAAALATAGWLRRALGLVVAAVAVVGAVVAAGRGGLATVLGMVAALLLAAAAALLAVHGHRMPRMGARYRAPGGPAKRDPWDELDAGRDPTV